MGSQLCRALVGAGHEVRAFHRPTSSLRGLDGLDVEHAIGDVTLLESLAAAMAGVDAVFHVAAQLGGTTGTRRMFAVTVEGTRAVVQTALQAGVRRLVHTSSVAALGVPESSPSAGLDPSMPLLDENHSWNYPPEDWPYGYTKYLAELEVQKAVAQGLEAVIVNPTYVVGAGDVYRQNSSVLMQVAQGLVPVSVPGGLNVVHVADVVAGHLASLERGCPGERYILGGQNMTHAHFLELAAYITGAQPPKAVLPAGLVRMVVGPVRLARPFMKLSFAPEMLRLAGIYFYYDLRKARQALGLGDPRPIDAALCEAYAWNLGEAKRNRG